MDAHVIWKREKKVAKTFLLKIVTSFTRSQKHDREYSKSDCFTILFVTANAHPGLLMPGFKQYQLSLSLPRHYERGIHKGC